MGESKADREEELLRQQQIFAKFGELAIRSSDLDEILQEATRLVSEALGTELAKVMELQEDGITLLVKVGVGWKPGVVGHVRVKAEKGSSEGYALQTGEPVTSDDIDNEERFTYADFLKDNAVHALINVPIVGTRGERPYGILEVDSRERRAFSEGDVGFLRTYANLVAAAVQRFRMAKEAERTNAALRASEDHLRATATSIRNLLDRRRRRAHLGLQRAVADLDWRHAGRGAGNGLDQLPPSRRPVCHGRGLVARVSHR